MSRNLDDILNEPRVTLSNRAVKLLDGKPIFDELVKEAYQLGHDIAKDSYAEQTRNLEATIEGLTTALEAKNYVSVTVNAHTISWKSVLIILILYILTTILFLYARPLINT